MLKKYLIVFLVSMVPLIELRGAIPISQGMGAADLDLLCGIHYREYGAGSVYLSVCT